MQSKINYQRILDKTIEQLPTDHVPQLFLHACCAPCSSYVLEYLSQYFEITLFFYNPNIFPQKEYLYRKQELCRLVSVLPTKHPVHIIDGDYIPQRFLDLAKGHEKEPERGPRCRLCIGHRLEETMKYVKEHGLSVDYVCTTLSISPHKDAAFINAKGQELSEQYQIPWLFADFKKKGGYLRSIALSAEYNLYRQNFCGCVYSKANMEEHTTE